ncbi:MULTISPECIES: MFS transporter [unclassified Shinella]|uniref:MFS transporter n=1 Tax=unclassified Shinella TaxID=2643062 RepID=UPI00225D4FCE|nr:MULTISPECIES: MFS transporter [unclassified Shinella]MCO5136429.1 MFS transporter [Shinella sp.]MDC7253894.1 MFS transporter [Shinella sp. YE25]CAI0336546.1 MFS transporter [Rhizobiaceae bacterium]CAK7255080.1 MFS transporter [Shinella sp. WSC3-e]
MKALFSPPFVRVWLGSTASGLATWALPFVLGLAVLDGRLSAADLGLALAARTIGFLVAVPIAGVLSDERGPRQIIFVSGVVAAGSIPIMIAGLYAHGVSGLLLLLAGASVIGVGQGACRPAYQAIIPEIAKSDRLQAANAVMSIAVRVTSILGPATISFVALWSGTVAAFGVIALLWLASALMPPNVTGRSTGLPRGEGLTFGRLVRDFCEGAREARGHPWFMAGLLSLTVTVAAGYSVTSVLLPGISQEAFGSAALMTSTATAYMVGALAGALLMARWHPRRRGWVALAGLALYGLVPFSLLFADIRIIPILAYFVAGVGIEIFNVPWFTSVQNEIPPNRLSRVSSIDFLFSYGLAPLGLALIAPLATVLGRDVLLICVGLACLFIPAAAALAPTAPSFSKRHSPARGASGEHGGHGDHL